MITWKQALLGMLFAVALMLFVPVLSIAGDLEPSAAPGPTMKTMDEVYSTKSWSKKISCDSTTNCPRFEVLADFNNEAVLDKETGLVWEKAPANSIMGVEWMTATVTCPNRATGNRKGWRLPTVEELASLVDLSVAYPGPTLPSGHPFTNVGSLFYWSVTTDLSYTTNAWYVDFSEGVVAGCNKASGLYVWCVRGGQGYIGQ